MNFGDVFTLACLKLTLSVDKGYTVEHTYNNALKVKCFENWLRKIPVQNLPLSNTTLNGAYKS